MLRKDARGMDAYLRAGAEARLCKDLLTMMELDLGAVLSVPDQNILHRAIRRIDQVVSRAEDNMFRDYPELPRSYIDVFYGSVKEEGESFSKVNEEVITAARGIVSELFSGADAESNKEKELVEA